MRSAPSSSYSQARDNGYLSNNSEIRSAAAPLKKYSESAVDAMAVVTTPKRKDREYDYDRDVYSSAKRNALPN